MDTRNDIALAISAATGMDAAELLSYIEIPPDSSMGDCRSVSTVANDRPSPGSQLPMVHCSSHLAALPPLSGTSLSAAAATVTNVAAASTSAAIRRSHCFISITSDKYMLTMGCVMTRGRFALPSATYFCQITLCKHSGC